MSKAAEVQRGWDIDDDRLQFTSRDDVLNLDVALDNGIVFWLGWFGPLRLRLRLLMLIGLRVCLVRDTGLVLGGGVFGPRTVRLGGPEVWRARKNLLILKRE